MRQPTSFEKKFARGLILVQHCIAIWGICFVGLASLEVIQTKICALVSLVPVVLWAGYMLLFRRKKTWSTLLGTTIDPPEA